MINKNKICSAHQPAFLPWCGYIHKILLSDDFIFMDIAKFRKRSFMHRNLIEINGLEHFLGLRLSKSSDLLCCDEVKLEKKNIGILDDIVNKIEHTYKNSKYKNDLDEFLNFSFKSFRGMGLNDLCIAQISFFVDKFKIKSRIIKESEILSKDKINELGSSKRLLQHALITNSSYYLTGINSKNYLDTKIFIQNGIKNIIQNFEYMPFKKFQKSNAPLSIVHQIAMIGFNNINLILRNEQITKKEILNND